MKVTESESVMVNHFRAAHLYTTWTLENLQVIYPYNTPNLDPKDLPYHTRATCPSSNTTKIIVARSKPIDAIRCKADSSY